MSKYNKKMYLLVIQNNMIMTNWLNKNKKLPQKKIIKLASYNLN